ncbi:MAG: hypothetical protein HN904_04550 [Victivallales bacterium]|nr:hypothetical protein [Victivallales bacterium]
MAPPSIHPSLRYLAVAMVVFAALALADPALITPTPREIDLAGAPVPVAGGVIVLAGAHAKLQVAAGEINHRLTDGLLAKPLPVLAGGVDRLGTASGPVFVIGIAGTSAMTATARAYAVTVPAKPQGYGIATHRREGKLVMVLAGHDAQGALYAAVTLRHLLDPANGAKLANGRAVVRPARIQDWPDFAWRQIGRPPANVGIGWELKAASQKGTPDIAAVGARFVREEKQYVDHMLRHKMNLAWTHATHLARGGEGQYPFLRQVSDYARARGVHFVEKTQTQVGTYPRDKDDPRKSRCVDHRVHKKYFCWSLLDVHRERARAMAKAMKASGIHWLYLHATDGGGWENPARWGERCAECRRIYGDDHAQADAAVFGTWHRIMREEIPDFRLIAVVYPYNGGSIAPAEIERRLVQKSGAIPNAQALAQKIATSHQGFLTRLGTLLPPDVFICQREVLRNHYALMTKCYGKRGFQIYLEQKHDRGWGPEFTITGGWLKTFYRPDHEDVFYASDASWGLNYLSEMMAAQFGWNVASPGAKEFTNPGLRSSDIDHHIEPREVSKAYIERFCRDFYGPEIGPYMVAVYDSNISYRFIQRPQLLIGQMGIRDPAERMQQMVDATARAMKSLGEARQVYDAALAAGRKPIPNELAARMFGEMYRAILVSSRVAPYQLRMLQARPAVIDGDLEKAKRLVVEMRGAIAEGKAAWAASWPWLKGVPIVRCRNPNWVYTFGQFQNYDYSKLEDEVGAFEGGMEKLFEAYNTPKWFKKAMQERVLHAVPALAPPTIDGRLVEQAWQTAPRNSFFVDHRTSVPAERETAAQVLHDRTGLYVAYTVYEPGADKVLIEKKARDDHQWNPGHSVELFVDANGDKETYTHYIWGIDGSILDGKKIRDANGMLKMDNAGFTSALKSAIARYPDRWTLEAWIPADELGGMPRPGQEWRANLCRNLIRSDGERESASTVLMAGSSFHSPAKFTALRLLRTVPPRPAPVVEFAVEAVKTGARTIGDGAGYEIELDIGLNTTVPLHGVSLTAKAFAGNDPKGEFTVFENQSIRLMWRSREAVRYLVRTPERGLHVDFCLTAEEGSWVFRRKYGTPAPRALPPTFVPGISGQALGGSANLPTAVQSGQLFDSRQGTLEMWVKVALPLRRELRFGREPQHVLFSQSPIRYDHPLLDNTRSVCLRRNGSQLVGRVSTKEYQSVWTQASIAAWDQPGWHHIAMQWSATNEDALSVELYLDGKKASGQVNRILKGRKWHKKTEAMSVQLGSMITGAGALGWPIDEVRISLAPRYTTNFVPAKRAELDRLATAIFHFDGDLTGQTPGGKTVPAVAGPGALR